MLMLSGSGRDFLLPACVLSVTPERFGDTGEAYSDKAHADDRVVTARCLQAAAARVEATMTKRVAGASVTSEAAIAGFYSALVVRSGAKGTDAEPRKFSGTNPTYFTADAIAWVRARGVQHLLVDLPSMDKEEDGGLLIAHRAFWGLSAGEVDPPSDRSLLPRHTITELVLAPAALQDGPVLLNLQIAPIALDAAPSRPVVYPVEPIVSP